VELTQAEQAEWDVQAFQLMREWGFDLADFILQSSGLVTTAIRIQDPWKGIEAKFIEVFISIKPN
jgi:hypothetical protein